jgi:hypothetical protein
MVDLVADGGNFQGVYSVGNALDAPTHELTPPRDTIEEVVADLLKEQARRRIIYFAQIISTATLHPIESSEATIERLRQWDMSESGGASRKPSSLSSSMGFETATIGQSFGYLLLAMAVICIGTVVGVLLVQ